MNTINQIKDLPTFRAFVGTGEAEMPIAGSVYRHWDTACPTTLLVAMGVVLAHEGNPWVFVADRGHFEQFCGPVDIAALNALSDEQASALLTWDRANLWW